MHDKGMDGTTKIDARKPRTCLENGRESEPVKTRIGSYHLGVILEGVVEEVVIGMKFDDGVIEEDVWLGNFVEQLASMVELVELRGRLKEF